MPPVPRPTHPTVTRRTFLAWVAVAALAALPTEEEEEDPPP